MFGVLNDKVLEGTYEELEKLGCEYIVKTEKLAYYKAFYNITDYTTDYAKDLEKKVFHKFPDYEEGKIIEERLKVLEFKSLDDYDTEYARNLEAEIWGDSPDYVKGEMIAEMKAKRE